MCVLYPTGYQLDWFWHDTTLTSEFSDPFPSRDAAIAAHAQALEKANADQVASEEFAAAEQLQALAGALPGMAA
jgi:hypothetical protein